MNTTTEKLRKYSLPISPDYVANWGWWEACRELLQNSIDQCKSDWQSAPVFDYDPKGETLRIGTTNCRLAPKTLLLGCSSKRGEARYLGEHGEGYKLALLVFTRSMIPVTVYNADEIWIPKFEFSPLYGEHILTVEVVPNPEPINGVDFLLGDVTQDRFAEVCANYLPNENTDRILDDEYLKGRIFIGGLFVCEIPEMVCGYNFAPGTLHVDRDRQVLSSYDVSQQASRLWAGVGDQRRTIKMLARGARDVEYLDWYADMRTSQRLAMAWAADNPGAVPVATQADVEANRGRSTVMVNRQLRDIIYKAIPPVPPPKIDTPQDRLTAHYAKWSWNMDPQEAEEFQELVKAAALWS